MKDVYYDVVVAGHICLDISPAFPTERYAEVEKILAPGKIVNLNGVTISGGGLVANTGFAFKKLGVRIKPLANIGDDLFGKALNEIVYDNCGEKISYNKKITTSYSVVLSIPGLDRIILHDPAGNNVFSSADICYDTVEKAKVFHFGYPSLMNKIFDNGGEELISIYQKAKHTGAATSLDMALPDPSSKAGKADWRSIIAKALPYVDIFLPSIEEALYMLDRQEYKRVKSTAGAGDFVDFVDLSVLPRLGQKIIDMGTSVAVIKCGSKGMYVKTAGQERLDLGTLKLDKQIWAKKEIFEESYRVKSFVSALAAGDTTIAGFLTAMIKGMDIYDAAKIACKTGALCCETYDAVSGLQSFDAIANMIKREHLKNPLKNAPGSYKYNNDKKTWDIV